MDESTWESYNEFYNELKTDKNSMDIFEDGLKCFSSYLCHASRDYAYNATYLPGFIEEFRIFIKAFSIKYEIAKALFEAAESYHNLTLKIDRYWLFETDENGKVKKSILGGPDFVSEKTLTIISKTERKSNFDIKRPRENERLLFESKSYCYADY